MSRGEPIPLGRALRTADLLRSLWGLACERIEIVGSIARQAPFVHDVEILAEPRTPHDLLGEPMGEDDLTKFLREQIGYGDFVFRRKDGTPAQSSPGKQAEALQLDRRFVPLIYQRHQIPVDLFIVRPPAQWGVLQAIRTGPANYARDLMVAARRKGLRVAEGALRDAKGRVIKTPTEREFFEAIGEPWAPPEAR